MSIRDKVVDNIYESDICYEYALDAHLRENTKLGLIVYPNGDLVVEEISDDYDGHGYILSSTADTRCQCELCTEWNIAEKNFKWGHASEDDMELLNAFDDKKDFIEEELYLSDEVTHLKDDSAKIVEHDIEQGFFDDEERPVENKELF